MTEFKLGIVGSEAAKFTPETEEKARTAIRALIKKFGATTVVSGGCHLGGIDLWAEEECRSVLNTEPIVFAPKTKQWDPPGQYGYKARNLDIAKTCDACVCITVAELPQVYAGMRFDGCYHCDRHKRPAALYVPPHVKSGGCWTMWKAFLMGKPVDLVVIQ